MKRAWTYQMAALLALAMQVVVMFPSKADAQAWPTRPIRLVVPFAAGGATDMMARILAAGLTKSLGQQIIIDNKLGAAGALAAEFVARSEPDGYTLCLCTSGTLTVIPFLNEKLGYDPVGDFIPVSHFANFENILVARADFPAATLAELISLAKSKPGTFTYGSPGVNGTQHLGAASFFQMAGISLIHVPYKGEAPTLTDLMGGQIDLGMVTLVGAEPLISAGKIKPIAIMTEHALPQLPGVPAIGESGFPEAAMDNFIGINVPTGTTQQIVTKWAAAIKTVMSDADVQGQMR
jgi:tripartite-type tricarboxylate transporter receptor subunit TctC